MRAFWKNMRLALVQNTLRIQGSLMHQHHKQLISGLYFGLYHCERQLLSGTESELQPEDCGSPPVILQSLCVRMSMGEGDAVSFSNLGIVSFCFKYYMRQR